MRFTTRVALENWFGSILTRLAFNLDTTRKRNSAQWVILAWCGNDCVAHDHAWTVQPFRCKSYNIVHCCCSKRLEGPTFAPTSFADEHQVCYKKFVDTCAGNNPLINSLSISLCVFSAILPALWLPYCVRSFNAFLSCWLCMCQCLFCHSCCKRESIATKFRSEPLWLISVVWDDKFWELHPPPPNDIT